MGSPRALLPSLKEVPSVGDLLGIPLCPGLKEQEVQGCPTWIETHMSSSKCSKWVRDFTSCTPPAGPILFPERLWKGSLLDPLFPHPSPQHLHKRCSHASLLMEHKDPENIGDHNSEHQDWESFPFPLLA